jgi:sugar/nucleoside kinase (ribokinase family)
MPEYYDVYGVGNALVDIQAQVDAEFLRRHGIEKGVMTLVSTEEQQTLLNDLDTSKLEVSSGGSACNTVVGLAGLGGRAYYAGKVGADKHGAFFQEELQKLGVTSDLPPVAGATGTCLVLITPDADRTMLTCLAASIQLEAGDIRPEDVAQSKFVYVEGYLWDAQGPRQASLEAMKAAREHGVPVAYTYSDPFCVSRARDDFLRITRESVQLVFCNEEEARMMTELSSGPEACAKIASWGPDVFMTAGADGAYYASGKDRVHIQSFPAKAIDTNGAGDLFAGGTLYGLSHGYSPEASARLGCYAASKIVQQYGARLKTSIRQDAQRILAGTSAD